jgi:outer membrane protein assembly factor BamB
VADGVVIVGTLGSSGEVYAVDAASGNLKWNTSSMQSDVFGPPKVFEGSIIVTGGTGSFSSIRSFDRVTGAEVWHYGTNGEMLALQLFNDTTTPTPPAAPGDACYAALQALCGKYRGNPVNCGMCANANAAKLLLTGCDIARIDAWCAGPPPPPPPTPPLLIAGGSGGFIALDARNGKLVWTAVSPPIPGQDGGGYVGEITVSNDTVYFGCWDGYVYAVDACQGTLRWRFKTDASPGLHGGVQSAPAVAPDGAIFFGDVSGTMHALESSGAQRWKNVDAGLAFDSSPVFFEGRVIIGDDANKVTAFDANAGGKIWSFGTGDAVESTPIVIQLDDCPPPPPPPPQTCIA